MKNIRAVVEVTNSRPKRRPMVVLSSSLSLLALVRTPSAVHSGLPGRSGPGPFSGSTVTCSCKCNFATLTDSYFRAALCAGILLERAQMPLPHLTCKCPLA
jgi:hypothetical protein